ncbi:hypothetical protein ES708_35115 [subsurface metagenome]
MKLINRIVYRKGFGNILAEGVVRASETIGRGTKKYAMAMKGQDLYEDMRMPKGWALGIALSTRGGGHCSFYIRPVLYALKSEQKPKWLNQS